MNKEEYDAQYSNYSSIISQLSEMGIIGFDKNKQQYYISPAIEMDHFPQSLGFGEIALLQNKGKNPSRLNTNITSEVIKGVFLDAPILASNMSTVTNADFCIELNYLGAMGVMHRAAPNDVLCEEIRKIRDNCKWAAASIGIGKDQLALAESLVNNGANILFVDIANGYNDSIIDFGKNLKTKHPNIKLVLGNTINENIIYDTHHFVDAIKVGIAQGFVCETKNTAGCTEKQFSAVYKFRRLSREFGIPVISDGGIREPSDFTKSIAAGANSAMAGKIFACCPESAAEAIEVDGEDKKIYAGMASRYVQNRWRGGVKKGTCPEGKVEYLSIGESALNLIERYSGALRSGMTYVGADCIEEMQNKARFVRL